MLHDVIIAISGLLKNVPAHFFVERVKSDGIPSNIQIILRVIVSDHGAE